MFTKLILVQAVVWSKFVSWYKIIMAWQNVPIQLLRTLPVLISNELLYPQTKSGILWIQPGHAAAAAAAMLDNVRLASLVFLYV